MGGVAGGTVGALLLGLAAAGVAVPGLPIIAMGLLAAALRGAGSGGTVGAIMGALVGSGIPEERARLYDEGLKSGGIVVGVTPKTEEDAESLEHEREASRSTGRIRGLRRRSVSSDTTVVAASLVLGLTGSGFAQTSGSDQMMGRHSMTGQVTSLDAQKG